MKIEDSVLHIRLSGTGGQGIILMGKLLAESAALHADLNVVLTKSYGPEARGGACKTDVLISKGEIDDLAGTHPNVLVCLSQQSCSKYFDNAAPPELLVLDSTNVKVVPTSRALEAPLSRIAIDQFGNAMTLNVVTLGLLCGIVNIVDRDAVAASIRSNMKEAFVDLNLRALDGGWKLAEEFRRSGGPLLLPDYGALSGRAPSGSTGPAAQPARRPRKRAASKPA